jgi:hypothetical protein
MPFPKLSAVLNNCPLHSLTPEIKSEIVQFGNNEHYDNHHNDQYIILKNKFAAFYELDPEAFTWKQFANLLENYNAFDSQIILGPVLRSFMKEPMAEDEMVPMIAEANEIETEAYINSKTELNPNTSRYESLSPDEVFSFVSKHLGISLTYHPQDAPSVTIDALHPVSEVHMYHQGGIDGAQEGGHWERSDKGEASINVQNQDDTQLNTIIQLLGDNPAVNPYGFNLLKNHVQINEKNIEPTAQSEIEIAQLNITAAQILKYISNINSVPKALAISLLSENLTPVTRQFIQEYEFEEVPANQIFERWIKAIDGQKPLLSENEQHVIIVLIAPVPQAINPDLLEKELNNKSLENETDDIELSEKLAQELQEQDLLAIKEEERLLHEDELLAQQLSAADNLHALPIVNNLLENTEQPAKELTNEESQSELQNKDLDPSEQLAKQLLEQDRLTLEQEASEQFASEQLAKQLSEKKPQTDLTQEDADTSEQLNSKLQDQQSLEQQELEKRQLASKQQARELQAKQLSEQEARAQLASEQPAKKLAEENPQTDLTQDDADTSEQLDSELQDQQLLEQQELERRKLASEQQARELQAKQLSEQQELQRRQLASEQQARELQAKQLSEQQELQRRQLASEQQARELQAKQLSEQQKQTKHQLTSQRSTGQQSDVNLPPTKDEPGVTKDKMQPAALKNEVKLKFHLQLDLLKDKMDDLASRREKHRNNPEEFESFDKAWNAANTLHTELDKAGTVYFNHPTPRSYQTFENTCNKLIDDAHVELDKHRGWSELLVNLAIGILTVGAGLLVKGVINLAMNKSFFHVHQTKSSELLDDIKTDIHNAAPSA